MIYRIKKGLCILAAAGMLLTCILISVTNVFGATEDGVKTVTVAYFYDRSYFGEKYDTPDKEGFGYNYLQAIANYSGWEYKYAYGDYNSLLQQFMLGKIDVMPGMPRDFGVHAYYRKLKEEADSDETRQSIDDNSIQVLYPNQPMNSMDYYLCLPGNTDSEELIVSKLMDKNVAYPSNVKDYAEGWSETAGLICNLVEYENVAACINALNNGEVSAIFSGSSAAEAGLTICKKVGSIDYYLAISSNNRELLKDVNNALDAINSSTDGFLQSLQSTFNSSGDLETKLSDAEKNWLEGHDKIRFGTLKDFAPYSVADQETGETDGFIYEAVPSLLSNINADIDIEFITYDKYEDMQTDLINDKIDAAYPVPSYLNVAENSGYTTTQDLAQDTMMVVYKGDFSESIFASIAYPEYGMEHYYDMVNYTSSMLIKYPSVEECLNAVNEDEVGCAVLRHYSVEDIIRNNNKYRKLKFIELPGMMEYAIGVKRGNTALYTLFIRGLSVTMQGYSMAAMLLEAISKTSAVPEDRLAGFLRPEVLILSIVIMVLLVILGMVIVWARRIRNASKRLKKANEEIIGISEHRQQNFDVIGILARDYSSVYKVDLNTEEIQTFRIEKTVDSSYSDMIRLGARFTEVFNQYVRDFVYEDDKQKMYDEIMIPVIRKKLRARNSYAVRYRKMINAAESRYFEFRVSTADMDVDGKVNSVVVAFIDCNDEILHEMEYMKSLEKTLKSDAVITGLTGDFDWVAYVTAMEDKDGASVTTYRIGEMFRKHFVDWENEKNFNEMIEKLANTLVYPDDRKYFIRETNKNHIRKHLMKEVAHYVNFRMDNEGTLEYYQLKFVADVTDGKLFGFILGFHSVDEEIKREREEQIRLEQMVEERTAQLEEKNISLNRMNNDIIELMGNVVEGRDEESGQHVRRVKDFTNILATQVMNDYPEYGLTQETVDIITSASALHDVGKITIPDSILLKPGRLTSEEFDIMKTHTVNGCLILEKMPADWDEQYMKISMEICRHHHEKYDGKGYPDALSGDNIPISAQIVSVADCYDALVSKRVYKDAFSCDEAFRMIREGECGTFNPKLMDCFAVCKDKFETQVNLTNSAGNNE